jgi:hypothetical protein
MFCFVLFFELNFKAKNFMAEDINLLIEQMKKTVAASKGKDKKHAKKRLQELYDLRKQNKSKQNSRTFYLMVSAVWFDGTVLDTNDISTVRGASLAILFTPDALVENLHTSFDAKVSFEIILSGASNIVLGITVNENEDSNALAREVALACRKFLQAEQKLVPQDALVEGAKTDHSKFDLNEMRFTVSTISQAKLSDVAGVENAANPQLIVSALKAKNALQQYRLSSTTIAKPEAKPNAIASVCAIDKVNPVREKDHNTNVSYSVAHKRRFGRARKKDFYLKVLKDADDNEMRKAVLDRVKKLDFSQSLSDMIYNREQQPLDGWSGPSAAISGKLAVIHLDGNKFGAISSSISSKEKLQTFSQAIRRFQANMLVHLLDWIVPENAVTSKNNDMIAPSSVLQETGEMLGERIRLETLLWGGDEMAFIVPAWRGWEAVGVLENALREFILSDAGVGRSLEKQLELHLTHAIGLCFANKNTPIRILKNMAGALSDNAKLLSPIVSNSVHDTSFGFDVGIVDSFDIADGDITSARSAMFSLNNEADNEITLGFHGFSPKNKDKSGLSWDAITTNLQELNKLIPNSQVSELLLKAGKIGIPKIHSNEMKEKEAWQDHLDKELSRLHASKPKNLERVKSLLDLNLGVTGNKFNVPLINLSWLRYLNGFVLPVGLSTRPFANSSSKITDNQSAA